MINLIEISFCRMIEVVVRHSPQLQKAQINLLFLSLQILNEQVVLVASYR